MSNEPEHNGKASAKEAFDSTETKPIPIAFVVARIPQALQERPQWVAWRYERRGKKWQKLPVDPSTGKLAKTNDAKTWSTLPAAAMRARCAGMAGIGYVFAPDDRFCGIDLDDCRDPETGDISAEASERIERFNTYAKISPSGTGVKLIGVGKLPGDGKNYGKAELYDQGRFFAMTGEALQGCPTEPQPCQEALDALYKECEAARAAAERWSTRRHEQNRTAGGRKPGHQDTSDLSANDDVELTPIERAKRYLKRKPSAVDGKNGSNSCFRAAMICYQGFGLTRWDDWRDAIDEWNKTCEGPWSEEELRHKFDSAAKKADSARIGELLRKKLRRKKPCKEHPTGINGTAFGSYPSSAARPSIRIDAGNENLAEVTAEAWEAIAATNNPPTFFAMGRCRRASRPTTMVVPSCGE